MVNSAASPATNRKPSKVEGIKENSNFLREPVATEILQDTTHFSEDAIQILKFHGSYQQDNRDNRVKGQEKDYQMMLRTKNPGGLVPPELYLALDKLADEYGNHTLQSYYSSRLSATRNFKEESESSNRYNCQKSRFNFGCLW